MSFDSAPKKDLIEYHDRACLLCDEVYVLSIFIAHPKKQFFICKECLAELKRYIQ